MNLNELRARLTDVENELRSIDHAAGDNALRGANAERWETLISERETLQSSIRVEERRDGLRGGVLRGTLVTENGDSGRDAPQAGGRSPVAGTERSSALRTVESLERSGDLPTYAADRVDSLIRSGNDQDLAARWVTVTGSAEYRSAFGHLVQDPVRGHLQWSDQERQAFNAARGVQRELMRGMTLTDANGGYMVPLTLDPAILLTSAGSNNPLRRISRVVQTVTDQWQGVSSAGATAEWKTEAAEAADASFTVDDVPIPVHFGDAYVPYSYEWGMDALRATDELARVLGDAADNLQATAYTTGSGTGQPKGIITALVAAAATTPLITPTVAESFTAADVFKVQNALPARFQGNAQWLANLSIINEAAQFETTNGALRFPEIGDGRLLRRPLNECSNMDGAYDASATAANYVLLYGNFREFVIVDRIGTTLEFIPNVMGANGRPTGQRGALLWFRTGSDMTMSQAFRLLNVATTA